MAHATSQSTSQLDERIEAYLAHLTVERGLSPNTLGAYRRDLSRYCEYLGSIGAKDLKDVTFEDVGRYLETVQIGKDGRTALSATSAARMLAAVRGLHRFALVEGWAPTDPSIDVSAPASAKRLPKAISTDEVERLLEAASTGDSLRALRDRALLELLYGTGARISEAVGMDLDDLDLTEKSESVRLFGKGRKERIVPLGRYAIEALQAYLVRARGPLMERGHGTSALFLNQRGTRLSRQSAWIAIQRAAEIAGLERHISPHTLRHSFGTHLLAGGADVRVIQDLMGHASVTTTQIYTMVTADTLREVYTTAHPRAMKSAKKS